MSLLVNYSEAVFVASFILLMLAGWLGNAIGKRRKMEGVALEDFRVIQAATLTLLGLIVGFTFSMALSRYDLRKNYEEAEANAIGTEYVRVGLMPPTDAASVQALLRDYVVLRIQYYRIGRGPGLEHVNQKTVQLQAALWASVQGYAADHKTPVDALVVSGMNDVLNSQSYTQAAWWNRIPFAAWLLMAAIAMAAAVLVGVGAGLAASGRVRLFILPLVLSIAFMLIADIDSPRHGLIRVVPQNMLSLSESIGSP